MHTKNIDNWSRMYITLFKTKKHDNQRVFFLRTTLEFVLMPSWPSYRSELYVNYVQ